ncbi:MAG: menaquinone biosynthesis protein [Deltaproteobacteria bacterium]|nr:menaquinone biosynthesis protein [Deltaproteobacteria bacterium]
MTLRIGRIAYLNVAPYFHFLHEEGFAGEIVSGVPSELNTMLAEGTLDACPSSSFEYGLHADDYFLLPGHSISSIGPVHSVLLFTPGPLSLLSGEEIAITGESATSINLLKILLKEFCGINDVSFKVPCGEVEPLLNGGQSALLIGDRALAAARDCPSNFQITDLGALWHHFTGMPFVFALWILRREAVEKSPDEICALAVQLHESRRRAFANLSDMAIQLSDKTGFSSDQLEKYWRGMSYDLSEGHVEGLRLYFTLCHKYGLLDKVPDFHLFPTL